MVSMIFMNQKGDFLLYIIFTIIILLIGAILVYVYLMPQDNINIDNPDSQSLTFKMQYPDKTISETTYQKTYPIKAKFKLDMSLIIADKNVNIFGKPEIMVSEHPFEIKNPNLVGFSGTIDKTGLLGNVSKIVSNDVSLDLRASINSNLQNIDKILIDNMYLDMEIPNITGELKILDKDRKLNKSYVQIKGFSGKLTILSDLGNQDYTVDLDGNVGYLKYIDGVEETILK